MRLPTDPKGLDPAPGEESGEDFGARFVHFAESEHRDFLRHAWRIGAALFAAAMIGEQVAFGHRFGASDILLACSFFLLQTAWLGERRLRGLAPPDADVRGALVVANGWMWALLCAVHTQAGDAVPYLQECVLVQTVFCYFFSGLGRRRAILCGALIGVALPLLLLALGDVGLAAIGRCMFSLLAINCVGALGCWRIEESQRTQFATHLMLSAQALTDPLTGLANRRGLHIGLEAALQIAHHQGQHIGMAVLDLDKFKPINDRYGHAAGDEMLREVARRLRSVARRNTDTVARLGGDEFAVIWAARSIPDLYVLAERLQGITDSMELKLPSDPKLTIEASASSGVLLIRRPHVDLPIPRLMERADGMSLLIKRIGGRGMIVREWEEGQAPVLKAPARAHGAHALTRA